MFQNFLPLLCDYFLKIQKLNQELNFVSDGFLYLDEVSKNTGGYKYWKTENRFKNIIDQYSSAKNISCMESFNEIKKSMSRNCS